MKEKDFDNEWSRGWAYSGKNRFGFGLWMGLFFLAWGTFELGVQFGYIKNISFPFWPLLLVIIGLSMVLKRI
ncbi:hypothetical protein HY989_04565 [Candidatus Micrarchaeota archaeon]|nr:hypothetical protein [Candidatus Micrarchaeota archaeon]